ncbi:sugar ABC transporter ATP-binding protein [Rhizobium rhizosphaerae]|uniref:Sugar ABC transporter ATP-binding protein n=1 Tax=Xaviernesmea rhizosphaerae TaxID=1672749 RepID=A0A1Q9ALY5_9HYPH|nr:sugar ABC transporter ATP-binding protein [Xaviernesmea rhizosphaerae]OLP56316.1 sugar ABC transporter ATP-binding protein [Xaviernesmea rhizosphaerae]
MTVSPALSMTGISKAFPGVRALDGVDFECVAGEVHAICGENGAGKSTLMKILGGSYRPDAGTIEVAGRAIHFTHPRQAAEMGIAIIHQELSLLPHRSVTENIFMGREIVRRGFLDKAAMHRKAALLLKRIGAEIDPRTLVSSLSIALQQLVEIAKALLLDARILVMDEPTAALDERDSRTLLALVSTLRREGVAIVYISHRMPEVTAIADRITILKDGRKVWTRRADSAPVTEIVRAMVGRDLKEFYPPAPVSPPGKVLLAVAGGNNAALDEIAFEVRAGEIIGVAGLEDSGKGALASALVGDAPFAGGTMMLGGKPTALRTPRQATAAGIGYLPGDRKREGLALRQSVRDNALLTLRSMAGLFTRPFKGALGNAKIDETLRTMDVRAADFGQEIGTLSGGNQQKAIIVRWLEQASQILVFVEPTRGIDIAAKAAIYETMRSFADSGRGIVVVSSDMPELIGIADRVIVMHQGRISGSVARGAGEEDIMNLALGLSGPALGRTVA